jgi:subtilisin family serine protease
MSIVAAGNEGGACSSLSNPVGIYDAAYTVGALQTGSDNLASFSAYGPVTIDGSQRLKPDLVAPGTRTRSSVLNGGYGIKDGTSMATPHVAGAIALLWSAYPELRGNIDLTENILNQSATPISSSSCGDMDSPNNGYGHGRLDILSAWEQTIIPQFSHTTPTYPNEVITFTSQTTGTLPFTLTWDFGDGTPSTQIGSADIPQITHHYTATGTYTVTLTAANAFQKHATSRRLTIEFVQYLPFLLK